MTTLARIEIVEDRTAESRCDEGFLRVRRLRLRNHYEDGRTSETYPCDIVSRRHVDAVAVVLFDLGGQGRVRVALRTGVRPPASLRDPSAFPEEGAAAPLLLAEIVAGVLEDVDVGPGGVERRAAIECGEEAGYAVSASDVRPLGGALYPSPGVTDERVSFRAAQADLDAAGFASGDGSVMEEAGEVVLLPLREAIRRCRSGEIPDMKTEIGLLRLCDAIGYVPALDRFLEELPEDLQHHAEDLPPLL